MAGASFMCASKPSMKILQRGKRVSHDQTLTISPLLSAGKLLDVLMTFYVCPGQN